MSGLSRETRILLERGRGESLPPAHRARLKKTVLAEVWGVAALTTSTVGWGATIAKVLAVVTLVGAATGWVAMTQTQRTVGRPLDQPPASVTAAEARPVPLDPSSAPAVQRSTTAAKEGVPFASSGTSIAVPLPAKAVPLRSVSADPPLKTQDPFLGSPSVTEPAAPVSDAPSTVQANAAFAPSSLDEEARLLRQANASLQSGDVEGCLLLLDEHAKRFPAGVLSPERSAERVFALCQAGRVTEARPLAAAFLAATPEGPLSKRIRSSCGGAQPVR
jgi:hypothetical protein